MSFTKESDCANLQSDSKEPTDCIAGFLSGSAAVCAKLHNDNF